MKLHFVFTFAFMATTLAIPSELNPRNPLEPRSAVGSPCKLVRQFLPDLEGVCVDTNSCSSCKNGELHKGLCPGGCSIICCIPKWRGRWSDVAGPELVRCVVDVYQFVILGHGIELTSRSRDRLLNPVCMGDPEVCKPQSVRARLKSCIWFCRFWETYPVFLEVTHRESRSETWVPIELDSISILFKGQGWWLFRGSRASKSILFIQIMNMNSYSPHSNPI